ncbi:VOC family protein [Nitratireductor sp. XY-223]|uniref:VOC family protein n=1 Tax=Nitratireductor sp. XY-223 TaxID=2561926 RepID=UPI0010AAA309|nr:VOC family protein [Nitratireductor sp. XY-223]
MIGYVMLGTNDLDRSVGFYDALLGEMGATRRNTTQRLAAWSFGDGRTVLSVTLPIDRNDASVGNGSMVALGVRSPEKVDALYARALELGGSSEGEPGYRGETFYAGYFRDPDGNKLNFFSYSE